MNSKREEIRLFIERQTKQALANMAFEMADDSDIKIIRKHARGIAQNVAYEVYREYSFLELANIMEWKQTRVRK